MRKLSIKFNDNSPVFSANFYVRRLFQISNRCSLKRNRCARSLDLNIPYANITPLFWVLGSMVVCSMLIWGCLYSRAMMMLIMESFLPLISFAWIVGSFLPVLLFNLYYIPRWWFSLLFSAHIWRDFAINFFTQDKAHTPRSPSCLLNVIILSRVKQHLVEHTSREKCPSITFLPFWTS